MPLAFCTWNVNKFTADKTQVVTDLVCKHDVVVLTETHFDNHAAAFFQIDGYHHFFKCRVQQWSTSSGHGGGVSVFVKRTLAVEFVRTDTALEVLFCRIKVTHSSRLVPLLIVGAYMAPADSVHYRQHAIDNPFHNLQTLIASTRDQSDRLLLTGDFNAHFGLLPDVPSVDNELASMDSSIAQLFGDLLFHNIPDRRQNSSGVHTNTFGASLIEQICQYCGVVICNGRTQGDMCGVCTFPTQRRNCGHQLLDLFLCSIDIFSWVATMSVSSDTLFGEHSDHWPVFLSLDTVGSPQACLLQGERYQKRKLPKFDHTRPEHYAKFVNTECNMRRISDLSSALAAGTLDADSFLSALTELLADALQRAFASAQEASPPPGREPNHPWWDVTCQAARDAKKSAFANLDAYKRSTSDPCTDVLCGLVADCKKATVLLKKAVFFAKCCYAEQQTNLFIESFYDNPKYFWSFFKPRVAPHSNAPDLERLKEHCVALYGEEHITPPAVVARTSDVISRAHTAYYMPYHALQEQFEAQGRTELLRLRAAQADAAGLGDNITISAAEVAHHFGKMKNYKAPGIDGIPNECFKYAKETRESASGQFYEHYYLAQVCADFFNHLLHNSCYPEGWCTTLLTAIYKGKGDVSDPSNYRGIAVACSLANCFASIIERKISTYLEASKLRAPGQAGFRRETGTHHNVFVLYHLITKYCAQPGKPLYTCFVDFKKAFDCVNRDFLWERLRVLGLQGKVLATIKNMYAKVQMRVKLSGRLSDVFQSFMGVKQGDPLSPTLFGAFIEVLPEFISLYRMLHIRRAGYTDSYLEDPVALGGEMLVYLLFADDLTLFANSLKDMQTLLVTLAHFCEHLGMEVNIAKTVCMFFCHEDNYEAVRNNVDSHPLYFNGQIVKFEDSFKYLGILFHCTGKSSLHTDTLAGAGRKALFALMSCFRNIKYLTPDLQIRLFMSKVLPVITYNCQVWGVELLDLPSNSSTVLYPQNALEKIFTDFLRYITGASRTCSNWVLVQECECDFVQTHIACCIASFWNSMIKADPVSPAKRAFVDDIKLTAAGNRRTWAARFITFLAKVNCLPEGYSGNARTDRRIATADVHLLLSHNIDINNLRNNIRSFWLTKAQSQCVGNPRDLTGLHPIVDTYMSWFYCAETVGTGRQQYFKYYIPAHHFKSLARLKTGSWSHLSVHAGRRGARDRRPPREQRVCMHAACNNCIEDERHAIFECDRFAHIRTEFADIFTPSLLESKCMRTLCNHADIKRLAHCVYTFDRALKPHNT